MPSSKPSKRKGGKKDTKSSASSPVVADTPVASDTLPSADTTPSLPSASAVPWRSIALVCLLCLLGLFVGSVSTMLRDGSPAPAPVVHTLQSELGELENERTSSRREVFKSRYLDPKAGSSFEVGAEGAAKKPSTPPVAEDRSTYRRTVFKTRYVQQEAELAKDLELFESMQAKRRSRLAAESAQAQDTQKQEESWGASSGVGYRQL